MRLLLLIIIGTIFVSCNRNGTSLEYLLIKGDDLDTIYMDIQSRQVTDSFNIIKYKVRWNKRENSPYEQEFRLPKRIDSTSRSDIRFVYEQTITFEGTEYKIMKYQFDEKNADDEESLFFYSPEFGIILFKWGTHRNNQRLIHAGDKQKDKVVYFLTEQIERDFDLSKRWH